MRAKDVDFRFGLQRMALWLVMTVCHTATGAELPAEIPRGECRNYFSEASDVPEQERLLMDNAEYTAATICRTLEGDRVTHGSLTTPAIVSSNVCVFRMDERSTDGARRWLSTATFMAMSTSNVCPRQDALHYVNVEGVSAGLFVQLWMFWEHLGTSKANFAEAIKGRPHDEFSDDLRSMLEGVFFAPERRNTLGSIRLNPAYLPWQGYEMSAAVDRFNSVSVVVDLTPTGIKLIDITSQVE